MDGARVQVSIPPEAEFMEGEQVPLPENALLGANGIFLLGDQQDSLLVHYFRQPVLFSLVSSAGGIVNPILYRGRSNAEMTMADFVGLRRSVGGHHILQVSDINSAKLFSLDVEASSYTGGAVIVQIRDIPGNTNRVFIMEDDKLLCQTLSGEYGFAYVEVDKEDKALRQFKIFGEGAHARDYSFFTSMDAIRPDKTAMVICMRALDKLNILDLEKGRHKTIVTSPEQKKSRDLTEWKTVDRTAPGYMYSYYYAVDCDEHAIYAIYSPGNEIRIFDWDGRFQRKMMVKEFLQDIKVVKSDKGLCLFCLTQDEKVYRYLL